MKKEWQKPWLEVLNVGRTMAGPGLRLEDEYQSDQDELVHYS